MVKPHSLDSTTSEENNTLQFLVVEKVVERPQTSFFSEWVRSQIRIVTVTRNKNIFECLLISLYTQVYIIGL
jgi:hypothetical protein